MKFIYFLLFSFMNLFSYGQNLNITLHDINFKINAKYNILETELLNYINSQKLTHKNDKNYDIDLKLTNDKYKFVLIDTENQTNNNFNIDIKYNSAIIPNKLFDDDGLKEKYLIFFEKLLTEKMTGNKNILYTKPMFIKINTLNAIYIQFKVNLQSENKTLINDVYTLINNDKIYTLEFSSDKNSKDKIDNLNKLFFNSLKLNE